MRALAAAAAAAWLVASASAQAGPYPLNLTCSPPVSRGGNGNCGPAWCSLARSDAPSCVFPTNTINYATEVGKATCRACTQSSAPQCATAALTALHGWPGSGVKAAFCNDAFLVIMGTGAGIEPYNLADVYNPPGANINGTQCVTRTASAGFLTNKIWLTPQLLPAASPTNNIEAYPGGPGETGYMYSPVYGTYGLPTAGAVGITISSQQIFPIFSNVVNLTPEHCETDSCNEHVGQGGGAPHLHGDPFGPTCLYSQANYTSLAAHPPLIGWAFDGFPIYGRHLSTAAPFYSLALDACGGHDHGAGDAVVGYHYHTQVLAAATDNGCVVRTIPAGTPYPVHTPGVHQCFRGNLSAIPLFFAARNVAGVAAQSQPCCGMSNFYAAPGIAIPGVTPSASAAAVASPSRSGSSSLAPTPAATTSPAATASPAATRSATSTAPPSDSPAETSSGSATASASQTASASSSPTPPQTGTPTNTRSLSAAATASRSGTAASSRTTTPSSSQSGTTSAAQTATGSPSASQTGSASASVSASLPSSPTGSPSPSASATGAPSTSPSPAGTGSGTQTASPSAAPSAPPTPDATRTSSGSASASAAPTSSPAASPSAAGTPPATPSAAATHSKTPSAAATVSKSPSPAATVSKSPSVVASASKSRSSAATVSRTRSPAATPSKSAARTPSVTASKKKKLL